jgi:hypothetical protein
MGSVRRQVDRSRNHPAAGIDPAAPRSRTAAVRAEDRRLLVYLAKNCLMGILAGWLLLGLLISSNVANLGHLLFGNGIELTALILISAGFAVTFGSLAMGTAIFLLPKE